MKIELVDIDKITPYVNNAKQHPDWQIEQIMSSIEQFGNNDPIALDGNNVIIEGHGRYLALKQLGYSEVPCIYLSHLTEEQKKAYILVHNKLTINTGFDLDLLSAELEMLHNLDMSEFGFEQIDDTDLDDLFEEHEEEEKVKQNYLVWHGGKVETTEVDEETLNQLLEEYEDLGETQSFVSWLITRYD